MVQWVGDTMIAYYCPASGAYAGAQIVTAFSAPSFTPVQIANLGSTNTFTSPGAPSPDGTQLLLSLPSGGLYVYPIAGGNPTTIDATGVNGGWMASGDIIWATAAGGVNEISLAAAEGASDAGAADSGAADSGAADSGAADSGAADSGAADSGAADSGAADSGAADSGAADSGAADSGAADSGAADAGGLKTIASSGVEFLLTISGDGNYFQGGTNFNSSSGLTNVVLLSAATGKVSSQWSQATAEAIGFTADSKYDLFLTNFPTVFGLETFDVYAAPVATGPATKILTGAMQLAFGAGSKLIVGVNPTKATGLTDLQLLDLASPSTPTTIVTQADPTIIYVPGTNKLLYSWYCQPGTPSGLWSTVVP
jgi:hypothetical protein